jgi:hypothetical protein
MLALSATDVLADSDSRELFPRYDPPPETEGHKRYRIERRKKNRQRKTASRRNR